MAQEKNFETKVKRYIEEKGGYQVKFFANRMTKKGVPDILSCINGYFVGVEVKGPDGSPSDIQIYNVKKIRKAGGFAMVLYPSAWERFKQFVDDLFKDEYDRDTEIEWR